MRLAGDDGRWNLSPRHLLVLIEIAQTESGFQQALQTLVHFFLADHSRLHRFRERTVNASTLYIGSSSYRLRRSLCRSLRRTMAARHIEVVDGSAIGSYQSLESPFITENLTLISGIATTWRPVNPLIGAHHLSHISILHQRFEGRQIGLPQITLRQILHIKTVPVPFRTAMYGKVLGTGQELDVLGRL